MKITSTATAPQSQTKPALTFPVLMEWKFDNNTPQANDPYVQGKQQLIVLFTDRVHGIVVAKTGVKITMEPEGFISVDYANWAKYEGEVTLTLKN